MSVMYSFNAMAKSLFYLFFSSIQYEMTDETLFNLAIY
jgi:hypothetical protein